MIETALGPVASRLGDAINRFEFDKALHILRQTRAASAG